MKAVLMAGGEGTRLRPLTTILPKPMIPVVNRPIMEYVIALLESEGIREVIATTCYLPSTIQEYFGDGKGFGVTIEYYVEGRPLGTAGGVRNAEEALDGTFLVVSGDLLTEMELKNMVRFHESVGAIATIALTRVPDPMEYGIVELNHDGRIKRFLEKPAEKEVFSNLINAGIYVLEPEVLKEVKPGTPFDFSRDLFPILLRKKLPLFGYVFQGYWNDVGNLTQYLQANYDVLAGQVAIKIPEIREGLSRGSTWIEGGLRREPRVIIKPPSALGKGCRLGTGSRIGPFTVLGDNVNVGKNVTIQRSVVMDGVSIGSCSRLSACAVGKGSTIGADTVTSQEAVAAGGTLEKGS
ncbi:MAG: sugar phosphate nucleotidyltransferase [Candidatus Bathyarchaeia archaeon]